MADRTPLEGGGELECVVCQAPYEPDEEHPERLRCPDCAAGVAA